MKCHSYDQFFEVIANRTRLKIIQSLYKSPKCVKDICEDIKEEQSNVSHSLRLLAKCHFVKVKQEGKCRVYSLQEKTIMPIMRMVDQHVKSHCTGHCWRRQ
ncbi:MAG: winged helix-turn-helix domain-containing protein [Nanoarchaeota archaeon]|nr:winged helix-turn-helix domain-containing protein [Nanoarchaeota archaeon]